MNQYLLILLVSSLSLVKSFFHGDHYDGALGHDLVYDDEHHLGPPSDDHFVHKSYPLSNPKLLSDKYEHENNKPHLIEHSIPELEHHHHSSIIDAQQNEGKSELNIDSEPEIYPLIPNHQYHQELYQTSKPRFDPSHLTVHGYENVHQSNSPSIMIMMSPHYHHITPTTTEEHVLKSSLQPDFIHQGYKDRLELFYQHRKPGDGFGPGGHFELMPKQEVKYFPVPEPVPVYKPFPVDKPYQISLDRPVPKLYKVIQPVIHKQTIIRSHVTHLTQEYPNQNYNKSK